MLPSVHKITRHHIPGNSTHYSDYLKNLKSHNASPDGLKIGASLWVVELCHFTLEIHKTV